MKKVNFHLQNDRTEKLTCKLHYEFKSSKAEGIKNAALYITYRIKNKIQLSIRDRDKGPPRVRNPEQSKEHQ